MVRKHLTRNGGVVSLDPADYILQGHKENTILLIERVVEYAENSDRPFTRTECWRACYGHHAAVCQTLLSLIRAGLVVVIDPSRSPQYLISIDKLKGWQESSVAQVSSAYPRYGSRY